MQYGDLFGDGDKKTGGAGRGGDPGSSSSPFCKPVPPEASGSGGGDPLFSHASALAAVYRERSTTLIMRRRDVGWKKTGRRPKGRNDMPW
ncbi:hypothetical protein CULT_70016 [[Clostridium] ultunense Esp]|nr:hypothetical protein CULT_70016 [[Clostridium] ultunense Esp]